MAALLLAEEGFHVLLCGAEFTQFDLRFLVAGVEPVFLRGKGLVFGIQLFEVRQRPEPVGLEIGASGLVHGKLCTVLLLELGGIPHSLELLCKGLVLPIDHKMPAQLLEGDHAGIVYCSTTKQVDETARLLQSRGIRAAAYHAKLDAEVRRKNQDDFLYDRVQVMVATNAFGMGIDKPNVRFVIHYNMPKDLESYYQEAGRAGRDGQPARCTLLYSGTDVRTIRFFIDKEREADNGLPADVKAEAARKAEERLKYMTFYSTTQHCLRGFLLQYFGEAAPKKCGNCSCCLAAEQEAQLQVEYARRRAAQSADRLEKPRRAKPAAGSLSEADEKLLNALYAVRKRLAGKQNLPAFMVFNDATLREMAEKKPMAEIKERVNKKTDL